jgi:hypothetical protein
MMDCGGLAGWPTTELSLYLVLDYSLCALILEEKIQLGPVAWAVRSVC